jgi:hypothetical protein
MVNRQWGRKDYSNSTIIVDSGDSISEGSEESEAYFLSEDSSDATTSTTAYAATSRDVLC